MNTQLPVVDDSIDNVGSSTWGYLKRHPAYWIAPLVVAIGLEVFFAYAEVPIAVIYLFPLFSFVIAYNRASAKIEHEFMQQFASANGFSYVLKGSLDGLDGALFKVGRSRAVSDVVSGTFQNYPISLFNYKYITGFGKSERVHPHTIYELQFDITMPDMLLENASYILFEEPLVSRISGKELIKLEGDFNKYFSLSITKGYEIEALEIFTPDVMQELIAKAKNFSVEIIDSHLFIYDDRIVVAKQDLYDLYGLAQYFVEKLGPVLARMKPSTQAMEEVQAEMKS
jgi:hypothetical protein